MSTLQQLHAYWCNKRGERPCPSRADLDPLDFTYALGDVSLIDVIYEEGRAPRYRVRLLGTNVQERIDTGMTGKDLEEFPESGSLELMRAAYPLVLKTRAPVAYPALFFEKERFRPFVCCIWPLSGDGEQIDMLFCCRERAATTPQKDPLEHITLWPCRDWPQNGRNIPLVAA